MSALISLVFLMSLVTMVFVYGMYFFDLSAFGKIMVRDHSELVGARCLSLGDSYRILQAVKGGRLAGSELSSEALRAHVRAKRLLYMGASLFLVVLVIGLADAVLSRHA